MVIRDSRRLVAGSCTASKFYVKDGRLELMFPDRDAHTDHVNLQLSVVSAGCVIAPDCTEKLESTSTLRFQTSARIVHELLDYSEPMAPLNMCRSRSIIHHLAVNEYPGAQ